ncbi:YraN family protein [Pseudomonas sp. GX19020]|uniref:YraN family protein n=1 Tax=Pseudomonas sp. GX19020 TaxID=2942277 RepID=UPI002018B091|nr:YraN family protein [Pseudomonas sp. GX19020]MCL4067632.1 YraN family protein [Pseudomonas sp. GX19020]
MPLDFVQNDPVASARARRGLRSHLTGLAAEEAVARKYQAQGYKILARRWRGAAGEVDIIAGKGDDLAIVEVKSARNHDIAAGYFGRAQQIRLGACAEEYLREIHLSARDPMTIVDMRFDLALVDGLGRVDIAEAAFFL